jgi:hypothetical protein
MGALIYLSALRKCPDCCIGNLWRGHSEWEAGAPPGCLSMFLKCAHPGCRHEFRVVWTDEPPGFAPVGRRVPRDEPDQYDKVSL